MLEATDIGDDGVPQTINDVTAPLDRRFELYPVAALMLDKSCDYLIKGLLPAADLCILYGPSGVGKSFLALDAALHIAAGREWAGCRVRSKGRGVIYVASEGARGFRRRVIAAIEHRGFGTTIPFALIEDAPDLGSKADLSCLIKAIEQQSKVLGFRPSLIVLDTLARSMAQLNESDSSAMATFISNAKVLSDTFGCMVMPIHHSGKDLERGMRGSSALQGAADAIWCVKAEEGANSFELQKMKDGASGAVRSFKLERYPLGLDADGDAMETQVVGDIGDPAAAKTKKPAPSAPEPDDVDRSLAMIRPWIVTEGQSGHARADGLPDDVSAVPVKLFTRTLVAKIKAARPDLERRSVTTTAGRHLKTLLQRGFALGRRSVDLVNARQTIRGSCRLRLSQRGLVNPQPVGSRRRSSGNIVVRRNRTGPPRWSEGRRWKERACDGCKRAAWVVETKDGLPCAGKDPTAQGGLKPKATCRGGAMTASLFRRRSATTQL